MKVKDLMIPLSECPHVAEDRSLQAAIIMLSAFRRRLRDSDYPPRFVLVTDSQYRVVGVLRHLEILRGLARAAGGGASHAELIALAPRVTAREAMTAYSESEHVDASASLEEAVEQMLSGSFRHLLVDEGGTTIGILRLSEVFARICRDVGRTAKE